MLKQLATALPHDLEGTVVAVGSQIVTAEGIRVPLGSICRIQSNSCAATLAEVVAIEGNQTRLAPLDRSHGVSTGEKVRFVTVTPTIPVSPQLLGRAVDCEGKPIDGGSPIASAFCQPIRAEPTQCLNRERCLQAIATGVRSIDAFHTLAQGQRIGIFAGAGVGKSSLLGMLARGTSADVVVAGLIGERGREVNDFLHHELTPELRSRSVTVVETSEASATRRVQAALSATSIAEYFRDQGLNVLLLMDSVTRFAQAQREIGLAAGEPPTTRGYPPSVFSALPQLLERAGINENKNGKRGSITGIYSVLVEGDDPNEPISDALRGILDGHILMSRNLAECGHFPAIEVTKSISRLHAQVCTEEHQRAAEIVRGMLADYLQHIDLIDIGAYQEGHNPRVDRAIAAKPSIDAFLQQRRNEPTSWETMLEGLTELAK